MPRTQAVVGDATELIELAPVRPGRPGPLVTSRPAPAKNGAYKRLRRLSFWGAFPADVLGLAAGAAAGLAVLSLVSTRAAGPDEGSLSAFLVDLAFVPVFVAVFALYGLYSRNARRLSAGLFVDLKDIVNAVVISGVIMGIASYLMKTSFGVAAPSTGKVFAFCLASVVTVPAARAALVRLRSQSEAVASRVVVVGTGSIAETVASHLRSLPGLQVVGCVDDNPVGSGGVLGGLDDLPELCRSLGVERVVVCFSQAHPERTVAMLRQLEGEVAVSIVPRYFELVTIRSRLEEVCGLPMIDVAPASLSPGARFVKRAFDMTVAGLGLLVLSPVLAVSAIAIKATTPGSVFFSQDRSGMGGRIFRIMKLRTMLDGAESDRPGLADLNEVDGPLFKLREDPRITSIGRFLRKTSLDEVPQLFNVLKGDMSLVGPRPFVVGEAAEIGGWARRRFDVRPGMTGVWQVSGRNELSFFELCRLDYLYVASWSFWWDLKILWHTPAIVFGGRGAS